MQLRYVASLAPEADGRYSVTFPQFPEIATFGEDFVDAVRAAKEALELVVEDMIDDGEVLPNPTDGPIGAIVQCGAHPYLIEIETADKAERVNLSIPGNLVLRIDRAANERGQSRSGFIVEAVRAALRGETA